MRLELSPLTLRLRTPVETARSILQERSGYLVTLRTVNGTGRGEAMPLEPFGTESLESSLRAAAAFELASLPSSPAEIAQATFPLASTPAARFAIECALLELLAKSLGQSVAALLGGGPRDLPVSALVDGADSAALGQAAEAAAREGFAAVKVKVGKRPLSVDAQRLLAVRRAIGPGVKLRVDANGGWSEATARSALRGVESLNLELCEQPVAAGDVDGLRRLRRQVPCRIAADEAVLVPGGVARLLDTEPGVAADVLVLKPMALGGLLPALEIARRAHEAGVGVYVTTLLDGPVARAAAAHLAAALPTADWAHGLATVELFEGAQADPFTPVRGRIQVSDAPGWGL